MRHLQRLRAARYLLILVSVLMTYGSAPAGFNASWTATFNAIQRIQIPPGLSEPPGPIYLGDNPSRGRSMWTARAMASLLYAAGEWGASPEERGALASTKPAGMPPGDPEDQGGGAAYPWEGKIHMLTGYVNTNTGNFLTAEPLTSFPSSNIEHLATKFR